MLHDTTAGWAPVSTAGARHSSHVVTRIMTTHAHDETHGGVASGPLG
jgi:hypothetical protein